ncbi:MAG: Crp/Fnr family transcriptional regulator [Balneolaceae bacterium]|nr:Crp/Fnr family transcriptional regulator [Balneolaceae bacterium]
METTFSDYLNSAIISLNAKQTLFKTGESIRFFYYIAGGGMKLERITEEGKKVVTSVCKKHQYLAEPSLFNNHYHCDAIATEDSRLLQFSKNEVLEILEQIPQIALQFSHQLAKEIHSLRQRLEFINVLNTENRILNFISIRSNNNRFSIPGSLKNLAAQVGLTHETLYGKLSILEQEGSIKRDGEIIQIL